MKPRLPKEIELYFPSVVIHEIYTYLTKHDSPPSSRTSYQNSPTFLKDIAKIQNMKLRGKSAMYMQDLDDFLLD